MEADGYFTEYPTPPMDRVLGPYQITAFTPAYDKDKYENTSWTLNGKIGDYLKARLHRQLPGPHTSINSNDYSNYLRSAGGS